jgi:hypothetical protein
MGGDGTERDTTGKCASCHGRLGSDPIMEEDPSTGEETSFCSRCGIQRFLCRHPLVAEAGTGLCCLCQELAMRYDAADYTGQMRGAYHYCGCCVIGVIDAVNSSRKAGLVASPSDGRPRPSPTIH